MTVLREASETWEECVYTAKKAGGVINRRHAMWIKI